MFIDSLKISSEEFEEKDSINWYTDEEICLKLTCPPIIENRKCNKYLQDEKEFKSVKRWPHELMHDLYVEILDYVKNKKYAFKINYAYCYDGATIPRLFWRLIGAPSDPRFIVAALIHDVLCQHHEYVDGDRKLTTTVLERCCRCTNTGAITRFLMYWTVDIFQSLVGKW